MTDQTATDFDWAPHQVKRGDFLKYGSSYRENDGLYPQKVSLVRGESADPEFKVSGLKCKYYVWGYRENLNPITFEIEDGLYEETSDLNISSLPYHNTDSEIDADSWRGVNPIRLKRKVLFTKKVDIETSKLQKWKPRAYIDFGKMELDDD